MPDLPDDLPHDLAALLRARAEDAPAVPAPGPHVVRAVRRRRTLRVAGAVSGTLAVVVAVGGVATALRPPAAAPVVPAGPSADPTPLFDDRYEFCTRPATDLLDVAVHGSELKFAHGCYRVQAGTAGVQFTNPQRVPHDLVVFPEGSTVLAQHAGPALFATEVVTATGEHAAVVKTLLPRPLAPGDYVLTCYVHPQMHAQLVVR